jgi:hypothetical protein
MTLGELIRLLDDKAYARLDRRDIPGHMALFAWTMGLNLKRKT